MSSFKKQLKIGALKALIHCVWATTRIDKVEGEEHLLEPIKAGEPVILCYWHDAHMMSLKYLLSLKSRFDWKLGALVSPSRDGDIAAKVLESWEVGIIRGSSSRTGALAMRDLYDMCKRGWSPVVTPDGPRGPALELKQGVVMLSQISKSPIVPITLRCDRAWRLRSWDHFVIPKPFSKITVLIHQPVQVAKRASQQEQEEIRLQIEKTMNSTAGLDSSQ